ncbi:type II toxin-antitoxin system RelE/ParE family toxin [Rhodanobacter sp. Si-c]|uniref:Type II toxin-antitoxin system RelE/ParE family toxin n=1 Tax=Rhodanobacter lycopersici TaxID=3162487 RepID=A0ABV3QGG5_9GAMM
MSNIEIRQYQTADGHIPFAEWLAALRDRRANQAIAARILRMQAGNRGDWKAVGGGVFELRIDTGSGYRVYCGQDGATLVLLLCAGDKRTQPKDIERAHDYWKDYQARR